MAMNLVQLMNLKNSKNNFFDNNFDYFEIKYLDQLNYIIKGPSSKILHHNEQFPILAETIKNWTYISSRLRLF